jgi:DNA-binding response OmpR family regulator
VQGAQQYFSICGPAGRGVLPIIFITALTDEAIRARALGSNLLLTKPFDGRTLIRCVSIALESQERNQYVIVLGFGADLARAKCERFWKVEIRGEKACPYDGRTHLSLQYRKAVPVSECHQTCTN